MDILWWLMFLECIVSIYCNSWLVSCREMGWSCLSRWVIQFPLHLLLTAVCRSPSARPPGSLFQRWQLINGCPLVLTSLRYPRSSHPSLTVNCSPNDPFPRLWTDWLLAVLLVKSWNDDGSCLAAQVTLNDIPAGKLQNPFLVLPESKSLLLGIKATSDLSRRDPSQEGMFGVANNNLNRMLILDATPCSVGWSRHNK